ncbi:MAG: hypothetical protein JKX73_02460 [Flavobacteriales bacterium]|nr:hypothetical protein [Flavobacteriales bacterium]
MNPPIRFFVLVLVMRLSSIELVQAQLVPTIEENIPFLVTFGNKGEKSWGDDDFSQVFFFVIPESNKNPVYIRIFDPDIGGKHDEDRTGFNSATKFSIYGGNGCVSARVASNTDPVEGYKTGNLIDSKIFRNDKQYDNKWYTFGPFNPMEGELMEEYGGYIIKIIAEGIEGDDGNLYRYFLSSEEKSNKPVAGGNAFTFEYSFRLSNDQEHVSHLYPYINDRVVSLKLHNFDWDNDGFIKVVSIARRGDFSKLSNENEWMTSTHVIADTEKNTSMDLQFIKSKTEKVENNNVVIYITNQYGEFLPFYTSPIGGIPKFKYAIGIKKK